MKKPTLKLWLVALLAMANLLVLPFSAGFIQSGYAQTADSGNATLSTLCRDVLGNSPTVTLPADKQGDIYAILGESISPDAPDNARYTCLEIHTCLRQKHRNSSAQETFIIQDLKQKYSYCLVMGKDGVDLLANYASMIYQWIAGIVGGICILIIIFSGIQISIGGLSQEEVSSAKERILRSLGGMVILFLSAFILYTINPIFFN
ncbi:MAG: pilin [Candidatus Gracilibacteria bacterium]|nr:pilin [Candidatus Gracilibacteria bacterium]